ncbi:MAG: hypothetical protein HFJ50_06080 [Clostridia bacterium]|nr:hypothetical protein [Clostridia bacterium]
MKKFNKIVEALKSKWLRNTGKTAILIAIIIAIFLGINILIQKLDPKDIDFTETQLYTLSDASKEKIASLPDEDKFEIYMFDFTEQDGVTELVKQYEKVNKNIKVEIVKAEDRPDLVSKYNVESGYYTVVIVNGEKSKIYTVYDFSTYDYSTGQTIDITEQRMTNGIISLSSIRKKYCYLCFDWT